MNYQSELVDKEDGLYCPENGCEWWVPHGMGYLYSNHRIAHSDDVRERYYHWRDKATDMLKLADEEVNAGDSDDLGHALVSIQWAIDALENAYETVDDDTEIEHRRYSEEEIEAFDRRADEAFAGENTTEADEWVENADEDC